jgi:hypothetical protein
VSATDPHRTIEAVWRIESARVIAGLTRLTRAMSASPKTSLRKPLLAALEQWPQSGVPEPGCGGEWGRVKPPQNLSTYDASTPTPGFVSRASEGIV